MGNRASELFQNAQGSLSTDMSKRWYPRPCGGGGTALLVRVRSTEYYEYGMMCSAPHSGSLGLSSRCVASGLFSLPWRPLTDGLVVFRVVPGPSGVPTRKDGSGSGRAWGKPIAPSTLLLYTPPSGLHAPPSPKIQGTKDQAGSQAISTPVEGQTLDISPISALPSKL